MCECGCRRSQAYLFARLLHEPSEKDMWGKKKKGERKKEVQEAKID